jgi:hypothetical protein
VAFRSFPVSGFGLAVMHSGLDQDIHLLLIGSLFFRAFIFFASFLTKKKAPRGALRQYNADELEPLSHAGLVALLMKVKGDYHLFLSPPCRLSSPRCPSRNGRGRGGQQRQPTPKRLSPTPKPRNSTRYRPSLTTPLLTTPPFLTAVA